MLEISHLTKIYKNTKGIDTLALCDVSLKFPETGMVFLLGKSGSGKSTLLNIIGGLDNPTSGEIIIKGKSSKDFSQSDFDSYRNTYVGFIFQEYNILEEFSVYDNIALAIELQNKPVNRSYVFELLEEVDLFGFENREPNTLSGGQKQRIAIARALIKNPEIIIADEPTGALDSVTGKQIFETLKKLSKERLVIVVSHDRDFAEEYGDRIIELKDGKVICDNSKIVEKKKDRGENISFSGDMLWVNDCNELTDVDFYKIKEFLKGSKKVVLSKNEKDITIFKKINNVIDGFETETFRATNEKDLKIKEYDQNKNIFIKSKLPTRHAFKIGFSSLFVKPLRLLFTVFLCSVAFLLFGLLSTLTFYDNENSFKETLRNTDMKYIFLGKDFPVKESYGFDDDHYTFDIEQSAPFYEEEFNNLKEKYGKDTFYGLNYYVSFDIDKKENDYYTTYFNSMAFMEKDNKLYKTIVGSYPQNTGEILLSSYIVDCLSYYGVLDANNKPVKINDRKDILGKEYIFKDRIYKVTGYFDSGSIDPRFEKLKISNKEEYLSTEYFSYLNDSIHLTAFVSKDEIKDLSYVSDMFDSSFVYSSGEMLAVIKNKGNANFDESYQIGYTKNNDKSVILNKNEVLISPFVFAELVLEKYSNNPEIYTKALNIKNRGEYINEEFHEYTNPEIIKYSKELFLLINEELEFDLKLYSYENNSSFGDTYSFKIKGIYDRNIRDFIVLNKDDFNQLLNLYKENSPSYYINEYDYDAKVTEYQKIYVPFNKTEKEIKEIWDIYSNTSLNEDGAKYTVFGNYVSVLEYLDELIKEFYKLFLYAGIFLCVFALLMLSNIISVSISNKTREIGILRAVGARSMDVFKIFFSESLIIMIVCLVLSILMCVRVCHSLNMGLAAELRISVFVFGMLSFVVMLGLSLVTTFIATYIPVRKAAKKKPVESIRSL